MASTIALNHIMGLDTDVREQLSDQIQDVNASEAFDYVPLETPPEVTMSYNSLLEANMYEFPMRLIFGVNGFESVNENSNSYNSISDDDSCDDDYSDNNNDGDDNVNTGVDDGNEEEPREVSPPGSDDRVTMIVHTADIADIAVGEEMNFADVGRQITHTFGVIEVYDDE